MRKIIALLLVAVIAMSFVACSMGKDKGSMGNNTTTNANNNAGGTNNETNGNNNSTNNGNNGNSGNNKTTTPATENMLESMIPDVSTNVNTEGQQ